jgi:hypothetical protein
MSASGDAAGLLSWGPGDTVMSDRPPDDSSLDPAGVFALLGDQTRLGIVTALYDVSLETPAAFSAVYDRIDMRDTAQFNYHLDRLVPHFVSKTDDGYELTERGKRIARVIVAETLTGGPADGPFDLEGECYACGAAALQGTYEDERFGVTCTACDVVLPSAPVPPSVVRPREPDAVGAAVDRWARAQVDLAARGSCPTCGGPVEPLLVEDASYGVDFDVLAAFECRACSRRTTTTFGALAIRHPAVRAFHRRRGADLADRRYWEIGQFVAHEHVTLEPGDPLRVCVSFHHDDDTIHVYFDDTLGITRTETLAGDADPADP